jgi:hypothetical protein
VFILSCVLCLRCCQCLCVVNSWLSLLFTLVFILCCFLCINRRHNQEWTTQRHWKHRIHTTREKINTRVNRRHNQEWTTQRHWQVSCVLCIRCCQFLCVVHSWLSLLFTLVFIVSCVLCIRCCRRDNQEWTMQRHWQHRIHKIQDKINTRVNRRHNQEWTTQRHWKHRIHTTREKINTRVNRRDNCCSFLIVPSVYSSVYCVLCLVYPMLPVYLCCSFLIVPSVYSSVYFVLCLVYPMLPVSLCCSFDEINTRVNRRDNQQWTT